MRRAALAVSLAVLPVLAGQPLTYADGATKLVGSVGILEASV